ncbi:MAG: N-acetylmuramoyl-L-alanine amidase [Rhodospirillaceae bacterium]|nr:N-acetylmuramoyl-L-alanine amidase [Rhodospirillaceae bacterium]
MYAKKQAEKIMGVVVVAAMAMVTTNTLALATAQDDIVRLGLAGFWISQHNAMTCLSIPFCVSRTYRAVTKFGVRVAAETAGSAKQTIADGRRLTVVLDPGHGGVDDGARSPSGLKEKMIALSTARLVERYLERDKRFRVLLTRRDDRYIRLRDRYEFARRHGAALFVSIHVDAHPSARMRGLSVYTLAEQASDQLAARLAARENRSDILAGVAFGDSSKSVSIILGDLVLRETRVGAARISSLIVRSARRRVHLLHKPERSARFIVLKAPDVPSVLVELGFLTNRDDEKLLSTIRYRKRLAVILARAIARYFGGASLSQRTRPPTILRRAAN